jgi:hypothetical protein
MENSKARNETGDITDILEDRIDNPSTQLHFGLLLALGQYSHVP